uniref:Histone-lysine N-methyltransferase SETMAR n=1 Tax=Strongyloides stercoralis TaxID=6248 RepID=A0AAF5DIU6_STRER
MGDRRLKLTEVAEDVGISKERVDHILVHILGLKKLPARWVPRSLSPSQKLQRLMISENCLALYEFNPEDFLRRFVTVDKTWIYHYTPETKKQSKQWTAKGKPAPKKQKVFHRQGK